MAWGANAILTGACLSSWFYTAHACIKIEQSIIILLCIWCSCTAIEAKSVFTKVNKSFDIIFSRINVRKKEYNPTNLFLSSCLIRQIAVRMPQEQLFLWSLVNAGKMSFEDLGLLYPLERSSRLNSSCLINCGEYTKAIHPECPQYATPSNNFRSSYWLIRRNH